MDYKDPNRAAATRAYGSKAPIRLTECSVHPPQNCFVKPRPYAPKSRGSLTRSPKSQPLTHSPKPPKDPTWTPKVCRIIAFYGFCGHSITYFFFFLGGGGGYVSLKPQALNPETPEAHPRYLVTHLQLAKADRAILVAALRSYVGFGVPGLAVWGSGFRVLGWFGAKG